jgi:hypothetical protein
MKPSLVVLLIRGWVDLYTRGMHAPARAARRDEIDDDVWCQHEEAVARGRSRRSLATEMLVRLVLGMPADLSWRLTHAKHAGIWGSGRSSSMLGFIRPVNMLCVLGGGVWLISYGALMINPSALGTVGIVGMTCGAILLAVAAAPLFRRATKSSGLRIIGLAGLVITAVTTVFALVLILVLGDVDNAWGVIDQEWLMWWGYAAFMGAMALVSVAASRTARSRAEVFGWGAAVLGAVGQPGLWLLYLYRPLDYRSMQTITGLMPIPIVLFGLAWIAIGVARVSFSSGQNRPQMAI